MPKSRRSTRENWRDWMRMSRGTLTLCPLLILVCASPAITHCAKPALMGSDTMHAMGMKGVVQRDLESCKSEAENIYRTGVQVQTPVRAQDSKCSRPGQAPLTTKPNPFECLPPESAVSPDRSRFDPAPRCTSSKSTEVPGKHVCTNC
jgi:hypothetical protein